MNGQQARYLWGQLCVEIVGVAGEDDVQRLTSLGIVAASHCLKHYPAGDAKDRKDVSDWLRALAAAIESD